ncbi:hypothetical protein V1477_002598 [Vespula maculifrons]|uniref:Uncharacterized protein n=1 Tax=Vespula maculifrons TaxID=7453 RepID=A0ABD2CV29_VESMC
MNYEVSVLTKKAWNITDVSHNVYKQYTYIGFSEDRDPSRKQKFSFYIQVTPKKVSQRGPRGDNIFKQQILSSDNFKSPFSILEFVRSDLQNLIMPFLNLNWTIRMYRCCEENKNISVPAVVLLINTTRENMFSKSLFLNDYRGDSSVTPSFLT